MESDGIITKGKFSYVGEILPNNERSNAIIASRKEEEQRRKEEAERVSLINSSISYIYLIISLILTL
jgi:Na+/H+ antiporter NhaB